MFTQSIATGGAEDAAPNTDLINALTGGNLRAVVLCPSNPFVSINPILAVPGVRDALRACTAPVVAVSPIVGGAAIKGPLAKMMRELGQEADAATVFDNYRDFLTGAVIDRADADAPAEPAAPSLQVQGGAEPVRHRVARGETVYSISRLYGVSVRALAEWNGLGPELTIREGQFLIIPLVLEQGQASADGNAPGSSVTPVPPSASDPLPDAIETAELPDAPDMQADTPTPEETAEEIAASEPQMLRPVQGSIIRPYSSRNEGIDIGASAGTPVRAAADGEVAAITRDTDQVPILVLRHPGNLLTVYANIDNIRVARGDRVSRGQTIADVGAGDPAFLHFEVRQGFESVDPTPYIE